MMNQTFLQRPLLLLIYTELTLTIHLRQANYKLPLYSTAGCPPIELSQSRTGAVGQL